MNCDKEKEWKPPSSLPPSPSPFPFPLPIRRNRREGVVYIENRKEAGTKFAKMIEREGKGDYKEWRGRRKEKGREEKGGWKGGNEKGKERKKVRL